MITIKKIMENLTRIILFLLAKQLKFSMEKENLEISLFKRDTLNLKPSRWGSIKSVTLDQNCFIRNFLNSMKFFCSLMLAIVIHVTDFKDDALSLSLRNIIRSHFAAL